MERIAAGLESAADALTTVDRSLPAHLATPGAFGADDEGVPGRLGKRLHEHWRAVLGARSREAAETARHLTELAADVRLTANAYTETDDEAGRRVRREI
ncbi:type VII secretion target [Pseudosporangium ferrugineum]|uniref:Excreted virulence factor EspC (Type VII ESX diderm) n=1 Tax=Pseudosporangium ferrugineum TaxID=439699 RepID=A0A2T0S7Q6_9ACTN|nr:type VII secretion target [Pseudosporangium ferrugineum]PRY29446.1 excreted virulence factor EspC (type VII ESX diderm) [Pseudosporangium ferrugineum]